MKKECFDERPRLPHDKKTPMMEIGDISKMFHDILRLKLEEKGIANCYRHIIFHLSHRDGLTQSELTKMAHLSAPSVSVTVEKMERDGLITKNVDSTDGRQWRLSLTDAGRAMDKTMFENLKETEKTALSCLSDEELKILGKLLAKVYDNLEAERDNYR